jgi:hypothetical protein
LPVYLLQAASTLCWVGGEINALFQLGEDGVTWVSIPFASVLGGDVTGESTASSVDKIKGVAYNTPPQVADGYVMTYVVPEEGEPYWTALAPSFSDLGGDVTGAAANNTVENLQSIPLDLSGEPDAGMVLTYEEEPAPHLTLKSPAAPQLAGDVSGASDNNTVDKIKNLPVQVSPEVSPGQALVYSIEPEPHLEFGSVASSDLSGDVTGTVDNNKVEKIQNISVAEPGDPGDGMVLTYVQEPEPHLALKYPEVQTMFGDVSGSTDNSTVDKIKNIPVSVSPEISPGQALVYSIDPEPHFEFDTVASESGITKLTGDVTAAGQGAVQATVTAIQGQAVSTTVPSPSSNLVWNTNTKAWEPQIAHNPPMVRQMPPDQYTQLWYTFDESGAPYKNSGQAGALNLTAGAGAVLTSRLGIFGSALNIVSGNGVTSGSTSVGESNSITASIWARITTYVDLGIIFAKLYGETWVDPFATVYAQLYLTGGDWYYGVVVGSTDYYWLVQGAQNRLPLNTWFHIAVTFDATTGIARAYVNGDLIAAGTAVVGNLGWGTHWPWQVGALTYNGTRVLPGQYDDFRVENVVRPAEYIKEMYRRGVGLHDSTAGLTIIEQGVQEWVVAREIDFTTLPTQPFAADGNYTIDGTAWKVENKASATSMGIVNGAGLVIACNSVGSVYNGSTRTAPLVTVPVSSFVPALGGNPRIRVLAQISVSGANAGYESGGLVIESTASPRFFNVKVVRGYNSDAWCISALRTVNSVSSADFKNTHDYANRDIVGFEFVDPSTVDALNGVFGPNVLWPEFVDGGSTGAWRHSVLSLTDAQAGISNQFSSLAQLSLGFVAHTGTANGTLTLTVKKLRIEYLGVVAGAESSRMPQDQYSFLEYYFDETSGSTIYNKVPATGATGNMTVSVAAGLQVGSPAPLFGRGLALSDDATKHRRVVGPTGAQLSWPSGDFTVAVWCTVTERGLEGGNGFIAGKAYKAVSAPDGSYSFWMWFQESGPYIHYGVKRGTGDFGSSVHLDFFKVPLHVPHLIGLTYASAIGTISLWVDGVLSGSYSQGSGPVDWGADGPLNIGDYPVSSNVVYSIGGVIEGLRIDACARPAQWWREAWQRCGGRGSIIGAGGSAGVVQMAGDVSGTSALSVVSKIQGQAWSSSAPGADKQVPQWNAGTKQWEPTTIPAGGDLTGTYPNPTVAKLQGKAVSSNAPATGQVLSWDSEWIPEVLGSPPLVSKRLPSDQYTQLWFKLDEDPGGPYRSSGASVLSMVNNTGAVITESAATLFGKGIQFDVTSGQAFGGLQSESTSVGLAPGSFSISCWVKATEWSYTTGLFMCVPVGGGNANLCLTMPYNGGSITFLIRRYNGDGVQYQAVLANPLSLNTWHLISVVYNTASGVFIYVDGALQQSWPGAKDAGVWVTPCYWWILGYDYQGYYVKGLACDFRVDFTARSQAYYQNMYAKGVAALPVVSDGNILSYDGNSARWLAAVPSGDIAAVGGTPGKFTTTGLQGRALSTSAPGDTTFLGWSTALTKWEPAVLGLLPPAARRPVSDAYTTLWFKLNESGSPWVCTKTALNLTATSATGAGTGTGPFGTAFQQTIYTGGGIKSADTSVGEVANEISGSAWVWIDNSTAYPYRVVFQKYNNIANEFGVRAVLTNDAGAALQLIVSVKTPNWQSDLYLGLSSAVRKFEWNLIAFTYLVSTCTLKVYAFNSLGVLTASQVAGSYGPFSINWGNHGPWSIGGPHDGSASPFVGMICDVRIENTIRDQAYYQAMYNAGASTPILSDKQLLTYHAASKNWISATAAGDVAPGELHGDLTVVGLRSSQIYDFTPDALTVGDVLTWTVNGWAPQAIPEGSSEVSGDVSGSVPGEVEVVGLRSTAIYDFTPDALSVGDVLTWTKNGWAPAETVAYVEVQDASGSALAHRQAIQFKGTAVTSVTDDEPSGRTVVQVDSGAGSALKVGNVEDVNEISFTIVGSDLSCDVTDVGGGKATVVLTHVSGGGGGAPTGASYVTMGLDGTLSAERVLTPGVGISVTDGGADKSVTIAASLTAGAGISIAQDGTALKITNTAGGASGMTGLGGDVEAGDKSTTATLKAIQGDPLNLVSLQDGDLLMYSSTEGDDPEWFNISSKITLDGDVQGYGFPAGEIATSVVGLRGKEVSSTAPSLNQVLSYSGSKWAPVTVPGALPVHFGYRASLDANSAVPMTDKTSTTLYFHPYASNILTLYTGGTYGWRSYQPGIFSVTPLLDQGVGVYDLFLVTSDLGVTYGCVTYKREANGTPGVSIPFTDGARTLGINKTMLWVATVLAVDDEGTIVMRDTPELRGLWNVYNRVDRELCTPLVTGYYGNWVYDTAAWRATENDALFNNFKVVTGIDGEVLHARATSLVALSFAAQSAAAGIGIDSTSVNSARTYGSAVKNADATVPVAITAEVDCPMAQGGHTVYWLEYGQGLFYYNYIDTCQAGMHGWIRM